MQILLFPHTILYVIDNIMMNTVMMLKAPVPAVRTPSHTIRRQVPRLARPVVMAVHSPDKRSSSESKSDNALAGVGGYLMDGVASIFSPMQNSRVPWIEPTGYTGRLSMLSDGVERWIPTV